MNNTRTLNRLFKRSSLLIACLFFGLAYGQNTASKDSLNPTYELRLDIFQLVILPGIELSYERFIDDLSSWGVTGFYNFDSEFYEGYRFENFEISPYYRVYFRQKKAQNSGFFVQPFLSLLKGEYEVYHNDFHYYYGNDFFGFAGGALIGFKWINQKRFSFEIHAGVGRYFKFDSENDSFQEGTAYPRISFAIGKRF
jgi:hypothetical protein